MFLMQEIIHRKKSYFIFIKVGKLIKVVYNYTKQKFRPIAIVPNIGALSLLSVPTK